jgi:hypothetical protein
MGAIKAIETEFEHIVTTLESEGHHLADRARTAWEALKADAPQVEHDAETDAAAVLKTAETQGLTAAEGEAVADAGTLAAEVASDVEQAADAPAPEPTPAPAPADAPAAPAEPSPAPATEPTA